MNFYIGLLVIIVIIVIVIFSYATIALYYIVRYRRHGDKRYAAFYIENEKLVINSTFKPHYHLNDINYVEVGYDRFYHPARDLGFIRVRTNDGNASRRHYFNTWASKSHKPFITRLFEVNIIPAVKRVTFDLEQANIPCSYIGYEYLGWREPLANIMKNQLPQPKDKYIDATLYWLWFLVLLIGSISAIKEGWAAHSYFDLTVGIIVCTFICIFLLSPLWNKIKIIWSARGRVSVKSFPKEEKRILQLVGEISAFDSAMVMKANTLLMNTESYLFIQDFILTCLEEHHYVVRLNKRISKTDFLQAIQQLITYKIKNPLIDANMLKTDGNLLSWCKVLNMCWKAQNIEISLIKLENKTYGLYLKI